MSKAPPEPPATTIGIEELARDAAHARLHAAAGARASLHVDCSGATRLPAAFIAAAIAAAGGGAVLRLTGLAPSAALALEVVDRAGVLGQGAGQHSSAPARELPFSVALRGDQLEVRMIALARGASRSAQLPHEWVRGISCARLVVDLGAVEHLDSPLVAWLLQLSQAAAPAKVALQQASAQAATQLRQLRLDHLLQIA